MTVVLSPNPYRDKGLKTAQQAEKLLRELGVETILCLPFHVEPGSRIELPEGREFPPLRRSLSKADVLVCFGGDGTLLHAAKDAAIHGVPILGINMGSVGFMAELEHSELAQLEKLAAGQYTVEPRMMLDVRVVREGREVYRDIALNDAVVTKGAVARVAELSVYADKVLISNFSGDGAILSTPTGSTAYSMAAGGPIVEPSAENIIFTPICAHALHTKSFVLDPQRLVSVQMPPASWKTVYLSVDGGKAFRISPGDRIEITRSDRKTRLVKLTGRSFYEILNHKLGRT